MPITSLLKPEVKKWFMKSASSELYAQFLYQYIANHMQRLGLFGSMEYFINERNDELKHYNILVSYVNDLGDILGVPSVPEITDTITSLSDALQIAYEVELALMKHYNDFYEYVEESEDHLTSQVLLQFLEIQRKSVGEYGDLISRLSLGGDIYAFDNEMGESVSKN